MEDTTEPRYTLTEAKREIAVRECRRYGHDFSVTSALGDGGAPRLVICDRCHQTWSVQRDEQEKSS